MKPEETWSGRWPGSRRCGRTIAAALLLTALPLLAQYDPALQYQNRGNRYEGLKPKLVSGYDVELLSALVDYREPSPTWPETLRLEFYLPAAEPVYITVRQPRPRTDYYWLDRVVPSSPWRPRALNEFTWPTEPVLRNLTRMTVDDLGAVVRLHQEDPRFTFKTNGSAFVTGTIYRGGKEIYQRPQSQEKAGSPFTLSWDAQKQPEGEYRLVLSGYFDGDNTPLAKEIDFYHRPSWR